MFLEYHLVLVDQVLLVAHLDLEVLTILAYQERHLYQRAQSDLNILTTLSHHVYHALYLLALPDLGWVKLGKIRAYLAEV